MERVESMKRKSSIVETAGRIKFAWQLYIRFLHEEATAKAEGKDVKELQKISLERRMLETVRRFFSLLREI